MRLSIRHTAATLFLGSSLLSAPAALSAQDPVSAPRLALTRTKFPGANAISYADSTHGVYLWVASWGRPGMPDAEVTTTFEPAAVERWTEVLSVLTRAAEGALPDSITELHAALRGADSTQMIVVRRREARKGKRGDKGVDLRRGGRWEKGYTVYFLAPRASTARGAAARFSVSADSATVLRFGTALLAAAVQGRVQSPLDSDPALAIFLNNPLDWATCVAPLPGNPPPRYPYELRREGRMGEVWASFVVDTTGRVDPATFEALLADHALFAEAVREALKAHRFRPAQRATGAVASRVHQRFMFQMASGY